MKVALIDIREDDEIEEAVDGILKALGLDEKQQGGKEKKAEKAEVKKDNERGK